MKDVLELSKMKMEELSSYARELGMERLPEKKQELVYAILERQYTPKRKKP